MQPYNPASKLSIEYALPAYSIPSAQLFDCLCSQIVISLKSLDFSYTCGVGGAGTGASSTDAIAASNPADQELVLNMASLLDVLLPNLIPAHAAGLVSAIDDTLRLRFMHWIEDLLLLCVPLSVSFPLVSCFYRVIHILIAHGEASSRGQLADQNAEVFIQFQVHALPLEPIGIPC